MYAADRCRNISTEGGVLLMVALDHFLGIDLQKAGKLIAGSSKRTSQPERSVSI